MVERFDPPRDLDWKPLPMRPDIAGQYVRYSDLAAASAEIERLTKERDEARAQVAMAYEAAADHCWNKRDLLADAEKKHVEAGLSGRDYYGRRLEVELLSRSIRALTPADARAALEAYGREKELEGMQRAADIAAFHVIYDDTPAHSVRDGIEVEILAEMEKEGEE